MSNGDSRMSHIDSPRICSMYSHHCVSVVMRQSYPQRRCSMYNIGVLTKSRYGFNGIILNSHLVQKQHCACVYHY